MLISNNIVPENPYNNPYLPQQFSQTTVQQTINPQPLKSLFYPVIVIGALCAGTSAFMGSFDFLSIFTSTMANIPIDELVASNLKYLFMAGGAISVLVNALTKIDGIIDSIQKEKDSNKIFVILGVYAAFSSAVLALEGVETAIFIMTALCGIIPKIASYVLGFLNLLFSTPQNTTGVEQFIEDAKEMKKELHGIYQENKSLSKKLGFHLTKLINITLLFTLAIFSVTGRVDKCQQFFTSLTSFSLGTQQCGSVRNEVYLEESSDMDPVIHQGLYWFLWSLGLGVGISTNLITGMLLMAKAAKPLAACISEIKNFFTCQNSYLSLLQNTACSAFSLTFLSNLIAVLFTTVLTFFYAINYPGYTLATVSNLLGEETWAIVTAWICAGLAMILPFVYGYTTTKKYITDRIYPYILQPCYNRMIKPLIEYLRSHLTNYFFQINFTDLFNQLNLNMQSFTGYWHRSMETTTENHYVTIV